MNMYREYVDSSQGNDWISEEELVSLGLVQKMRSTNKLQSINLDKLGITMPDINLATKRALQIYAKSWHKKWD